MHVLILQREELLGHAMLLAPVTQGLPLVSLGASFGKRVDVPSDRLQAPPKSDSWFTYHVLRGETRPTIVRAMKTSFSKTKLIMLAATLLAMPALTKADVQDRLYDFTDAYYLQNGINPANIDGRRQVGPLAAADTPIFSYQRPVRALLTLP